MKRKNIAMTVCTILSALTFIVIGACFSAFVYKDEVIKVKNPKVTVARNIQVFASDGEKTLDELKLSQMKLGLKPATGEEDSLTSIPTTITDKQGSEGQYAKFKLYAPEGAKVSIQNIKIENEKESAEDIAKERENIMVAIKGIDDSTKSLAGDKIELATVPASEDKEEYTFLIWLSGKAGNKLESSTISFDITFEQVV
ncbi:MAG: hypothetical protein IKC11_06230 [Clostridia bacterium]|nr:hypothetical protein [Clostridia bacterium]